MNKLTIRDAHLEGIHLIEASAGTGKTFSITRLVAKLLIEHKQITSITQILVMTFTKAAAQELRARINAHLNLLYQQWGNTSHPDLCNDLDSLHLFDTWQASGRSADDARAKLRSALVELDTAPISTIHSFCQRVLQDHAFLSALPMQFSFTDNVDDLILEAVADVYRTKRAQNDDNTRAFFNRWPTPEQLISCFRKAIAEPIVLAPFCAADVLDKGKQDKQLLKDGFDQNYQAINNEPNNKPEHLEMLQEIEAWLGSEQLEPPKIWGKFFNGNRFKGKSISAALKAYQVQSKDLVASLKKVEAQYQKALALETAQQVIEASRERLEANKRQRHILDISDPIYIVREQLENDTGTFAKAIRSQYPAALVDEFQDTDDAQNTILTKVYPGNDQSVLFQIGDPKQAIYAFRGGDVFAYLSARHRAQYEWSLDTNYRSNQQLVTDYNRLFSVQQSIFGAGIDYQSVNGAISQKVFADTNTPSPLTFVATDVTDCSVDQSRKAFADWAAAEISTLLTQGASIDGNTILASNIAVLVRSSSEADAVTKSLSDIGLSAVYSGGSERIFATPEAIQLTLALRGVLNPYHDRSLRVALTSELFGRHSTQRLAAIQSDHAQWREASNRLAHLKELWVKKGFLAMGLSLLESLETVSERHNRSLTNYMQLFELCQAQSQGHAQLDQLLNWVEQQIANPSNNSAYEINLDDDKDLIQIVTYHGSKGLEYPVVVLPFTSIARTSAKVKDEVISYHDDNLQLHSSIAGPIQPHIIEQQASEDADEVQRLLYVAITRASALCLIGVGDTKKVEQSAIARMTGYDGALGWQHHLTVNGFAFREPAIAQPVTVIATDTSILDSLTVDIDIDDQWQLTSFSSIAHRLKHSMIEAKDRDFTLARLPEPTQALELRFSLTKGAAAGNLLHDLMEYADFTKGNWADVATEPLASYGEPVNQPQLFEWLDQIVAAPIIGLDGLRLNQLPYSKTLREPEFYFDLPNARMQQLLSILQDHREQSAVISHSNQHLKGMMHGFIDLIFEHDGRYYVSDYKSNHLGNALTDYTPEQMTQSIRASNYDLQYLIYSLALHRHLQRSLPNYDPNLHFGGVYYFYLRGMNRSNHFGQYYHDIGVPTLTRLDQLFSESQL